MWLKQWCSFTTVNSRRIRRTESKHPRDTCGPKQMPQLLCKRVALCRKHIGWTRKQLAKRAGIAHSTLHAIEAGITKDMHTRTLIRLCHALHVSADYLLGINPVVTGHMRVAARPQE